MIGDEPRLGTRPELRDALLGVCVTCREIKEISPRSQECHPCHVKRLDRKAEAILEREFLPDRAATRRRIAGHAVLGITAIWTVSTLVLMLNAAGAGDHVARLGSIGLGIACVSIFAFMEAMSIGHRLIGGSP